MRVGIKLSLRSGTAYVDDYAFGSLWRSGKCEYVARVGTERQTGLRILVLEVRFEDSLDALSSIRRAAFPGLPHLRNLKGADLRTA